MQPSARQPAALVASSAVASVGGRRRFRVPDALRIEKDPLRISLFLLMIVTVSRIHQHFKAIGRLRPALVLAALTAIYAFLNPRLITPYGVMRTWPARVIAGIAVWACLSVPFGVSLGGSAVFIIDEFSKTMLLTFLLVVSVRRASDLFTLVWAYVISTGILVYFALFVFGIKKTGGEMYRLSNLYTWDANDVGVIVLVGMALTLVTLQTSGKWGRNASIVILIGIGATIARTGSRGAFLGLLVTALALLVLVKSVPLPRKLGLLGLALAALVVWAPPGYWEQMKTLQDPKEDYNWSSKDGRKEVAKRGLGYMMDYPIFGVGIHNFWRMECIEGEKVESRKIGHGIRCTPPHNSFIEAAAELGIPGVIMWSSLIFGGMESMRRMRRRLPPSWRTGDREERFLYLMTQYLIVAFAGFAVTSFFLSFAWIDIIYILAAFTAGMYVAVEHKLRQAGLQPAPLGPQPAAVLRPQQRQARPVASGSISLRTPPTPPEPTPPSSQ
jgi:O-antigen ligase